MRTAGAESAYGDKAWGAAAEDVQKWLSPLVAGFHSQAVDCATVWVNFIDCAKIAENTQREVNTPRHLN
ncbi:hypothetical protein TYRP_006701 [Tyrophagus putrescentiae]|nr:hypothetical protein TYRP_006701 [Tyrophagus putrescentiae]